MKNIEFLILTIFLISIISLKADIRYVSKTGSSTPPYMTWETAADSIQECINISDNGDTIYVGNGVYHESLTITKVLSLFGSSMDSTVIDGRGLNQLTIDVPQSVPVFNIKGFTIIGDGQEANGYALVCYYVVNIKSCRIKNCKVAIYAWGSTIEDVIITQSVEGIYSGCHGFTDYFKIQNCVIVLDTYDAQGINMGPGCNCYINNNIIIFDGGIGPAPGDGIYIDPYRLELKNNLIAGFSHGIIGSPWDSSFIYNNLFYGNSMGINISSTGQILRNNIFLNQKGTAIRSLAASVDLFVDYNLLWNNGQNYSGRLIKGPHMQIADPMIMKDGKPDSSLSTFDFHLQKYSPAIDKGDPLIRDKDGTISDLGYLGGPLGETYTYQDLAPRSPMNFTATVTSGQITFKWKKNTEADTAYYSIYTDSTQNFTIDSTKLLAKTADTLFTFLSPQVNKPYYFKVTARDKQGNESLPSEELYIFINVTGEEYPREISSYQLYNNYPNPFNPTTTISYRLKERGYVKLMVYDIKGETVKVLVNQEQESGYYETEFNAAGLASGIYIYRIEVIGKGNIPVYSEMKKAILLK